MDPHKNPASKQHYTRHAYEYHGGDCEKEGLATENHTHLTHNVTRTSLERP